MKATRIALLFAIIALCPTRFQVYATDSRAPTKPNAPDQYLGIWENEKGTLRFELLADATGTYSSLVVWASGETGDRGKASVGKPFAEGFRWDPTKNEFTDGVIVTSIPGSESAEELACILKPSGADSLALVVKKGIFSRTLRWNKVSP